MTRTAGAGGSSVMRETRRILVEVSGPARAAYERNEHAVPGDTAAAIRTEGHSEIVKVLAEDNPTRVISCGTDGCHPAQPD
jgi:hypothetical protein